MESYSLFTISDLFKKRFKLFYRSEEGSVLAEFAIAFPVQLLLVFGIMQMAFLYMSTLVVNFTAYRVARAAVVGEHVRDVNIDPEGVTGADVVAQTLLAPLAGRSLGGGDPLPQKSFVPGWGDISDSDYAAAKTKVVVITPDGTNAGLVTAIVEYNQELLFPGLDGLFRLIMRNDDTEYAEGERPEHLFGQEDEDFQGLGADDYIAEGSGRGRIRIIGGRVHYVITRKCSLYRSEQIE